MNDEIKKKEEEVLVSKKYIEELKAVVEKQGDKIDLLTAIADRKRNTDTNIPIGIEPMTSESTNRRIFSVSKDWK